MFGIEVLKHNLECLKIETNSEEHTGLEKTIILGEKVSYLIWINFVIYV